MHRIDADAHVGNLFSEGDPITGAPGTKIGADWLNAVQEEIVAVLTAAGISPVKANNAQLAAAVDALIRGLKAGALLRVGTSDGNDLELVRAGLTMLALTAAGVDAKSKQLNNVASLRLVPGAVGGSAAVEGDVWHDNVGNALRARLGGVAEILATRGWVEAGPTWQPATLRTNWSGTVAYAKFGGMVMVRGGATAAASADVIPFVLPAGYRPMTHSRVFVVGVKNGSAADGTFLMQIPPDGAVQSVSAAYTAGRTYHFDGITFAAEQ